MEGRRGGVGGWKVEEKEEWEGGRRKKRSGRVEDGRRGEGG